MMTHDKTIVSTMADVIQDALEFTSPAYGMRNVDNARRAIHQACTVIRRAEQYEAHPPSFSWHLVREDVPVLHPDDGTDMGTLQLWSIHT